MKFPPATVRIVVAVAFRLLKLPLAITKPVVPDPPRVKLMLPIFGKVKLLLPLKLNVFAAVFPRRFRPEVPIVVPATVKLLFKVALIVVSDPFVNTIPLEPAPPK